jgi:hypothetical protein
MNSRPTTQITIDHVVVTSARLYEQVKASLEARMRMLGNTDELVRQLMAAKPSWEEVRQTIERRTVGDRKSTIGDPDD